MSMDETTFSRALEHIQAVSLKHGPKKAMEIFECVNRIVMAIDGIDSEIAVLAFEEISAIIKAEKEAAIWRA